MKMIRTTVILMPLLPSTWKSLQLWKKKKNQTAFLWHAPLCCERSREPYDSNRNVTKRLGTNWN